MVFEYNNEQFMPITIPIFKLPCPIGCVRCYAEDIILAMAGRSYPPVLKKQPFGWNGEYRWLTASGHGAPDAGCRRPDHAWLNVDIEKAGPYSVMDNSCFDFAIGFVAQLALSQSIRDFSSQQSEVEYETSRQLFAFQSEASPQLNAKYSRDEVETVVNQYRSLLEDRLSETEDRFRLPFKVKHSRATRVIRGFVDMIT